MSIAIFYLFSACAIIGGIMVVMSRNPVHSVLWLILAFLSAAGLFVLQGAEFVAMLLVVVYVGAVAVLFLFVVMMLDIDFAELKGEFVKYLPLALLISLVILVQLGIGFGAWTINVDPAVLVVPIPQNTLNTNALGLVLYDRYVFVFMIAGLILLVAMIGAILLTLRHRTGVKRQNVLEQMWRDPAKSMTSHDVKPGEGL